MLMERSKASVAPMRKGGAHPFHAVRSASSRIVLPPIWRAAFREVPQKPGDHYLPRRFAQKKRLRRIDEACLDYSIDESMRAGGHFEKLHTIRISLAGHHGDWLPTRT